MPRTASWKVCPSPIHGFGVFAAKALTAHQEIGEIQVERFKTADLKTIPITCVRTSHDETLAAIGGFPLWYVNTATQPNVYVQEDRERVLVKAAQPIKKGEELTVGWRVSWQV